MYIVTEIQTNNDGSVGIINSSYTDRNQAESKYHEVLKYAAVTTLPKHACMMYSEEGFYLKSECYRNNSTPEPNENE